MSLGMSQLLKRYGVIKTGICYLEITLLESRSMGRKCNSITIQVLTQGWGGFSDGEDMILSLPPAVKETHIHT